ncbi:unnamed protein product [Polarella glacialis]|uniref:Uncharacterized protein n=1 Tax=Polarella glacialis TaxID=89957 RepID=A0A813FIT2_POLGL|nr:unnamed protein product [Polarella glacialis]
MTMGTGEVQVFSPSTLYDDVTSVMIDVDGQQVEVQIDREEGPRVVKIGGGPPGPNDFVKIPQPFKAHPNMSSAPNNLMTKSWGCFTTTERKQAVYMAAKINNCRMASRC